MWDTSAAVTPATLDWKLGTVVVVMPSVVEVVVEVEVEVEVVVVEVEVEVEVEVAASRSVAEREVRAELALPAWEAPPAPQAVITKAPTARIVQNQPVEARPRGR